MDRTPPHDLRAPETLSEAAGRALIRGLEESLGEGQITSCLDEPDRDVRTVESFTGRSLGRPLAWARPRSVEDCVKVVARCREAGARVVPIGEATTFWDPLRIDGAVLVDARALREPFAIDVDRRLARVGAGVTLAELDRAARAKGLCLAARPDTAGDTPAATVLAVGCTAGLGMGHGLPVELVSGATVVSGRGEVLHLGASRQLGGAAFTRSGAPDLLGLIAGAEGRGALIAELSFQLSSAPRLASVSLEGRGDLRDSLRPSLDAARRALDRGHLDSFRIELLHDARMPLPVIEALVRTFSYEGDADACAHARRLMADLPLGAFAGPMPVAEPESAIRGQPGSYEKLWSIPPGKHRERLGRAALWGLEVNVSWGPELDAVLASVQALFDDAAALAPLGRRFAVYPGHHALSVGVQVILPRDAAVIERARVMLREAMPGLLALGVVPYRPGFLWRGLVGGETRAAIDAAFAALDPDGIIAPRDAPEPPGS